MYIIKTIMKTRMIKRIQSEQTRQRILEAATTLFARKGFYGTSISDLAKASGITKGALYHHFESKDALFTAVVKSVKTIWSNEVAREVIQEKDSLSKIAVLLDSHTRLLCENQMLCLVMSNLMLEMENENPVYATVLKEVYKELSDFIERIILSCQEAGELRSDIDPQLAAFSIFSILKGIGCTPVFDHLCAGRIAMVGMLKQVLLDGLKA